MRRPLLFKGAAFVVLAASAAVTGASRDVSTDNAHGTALDRAVNEATFPFLGNACHVGLSIGLASGGKLRFYNYGSTSRERATLPTSRSVYEIASVTKTFTGALASMAIVSGQMRLDGDFRAYLPGPYPNLTWQGRPITLRSLATHRSGLPRDVPDTDAIYADQDAASRGPKLIALQRNLTHADLLAGLRGVALRSAPGTEQIYSNIGFQTIGFGLEQVYHEPFEAIVRRKILEPLGMSSTGFAIGGKGREELVVGYDAKGRRAPYHLRNAGAAYGLYSTTRDMANYLRWQLDERNPVVAKAHQPLVGDADDGEALVWNLAHSGNQRVLWHGGGTFGMSSQMMLFPDAHFGIVLLANDACKGTEGALKEIAMRVGGAWNSRRSIETGMNH